MLKSYLTAALRSFGRQKAYAFVNIVGLAVGLAASFFILLWVQDEVRHDRFHEDGDQLYRVMRNAYYGEGQLFTWPAIPMPLAEELETAYPEVEHAVLATWSQELVLSQGPDGVRYDGRHAGPAFFEAFTFPLLRGDAATALQQPSAIAISEEVAAAFFGADWRTQEVLGETIRVDDRYDATVTAVFAAVPKASSVQFDFVLPVEEFIARNEWTQDWGNNGLRLFVRLRPGADGAVVSDKIQDVVNDHTEDVRSDLFLQLVEEMYLYSNFEGGQQAGGRIAYVRIFSLVAVFLLLIASINFMNLATARSALRAREIGVRKAVGATRASLARQFLGESVLTALLAFLLAAALVVAGLSGFNTLTGKSLTLADIGGDTWALFFGIALATGLLAGTYPAFYLSSFNVIGVLRSAVVRTRGTVSLRKGLVVFQFALSILLIIGTLTVYRQVDYIQTKHIGLDRQNLVVLPLEGDAQAQYAAFKQELERQPGIARVAASWSDPLSIGSSTSGFTWEGKPDDDQTLFYILPADHGFIETMGMAVVAGRAFDEAFATDSNHVLINQAAAEAMGVDDPIGHSVSLWDRDGVVIGVVQDFHMTSLHDAIEPTVLRLSEVDNTRLYVRTEAGATETALASLEAVHERFNPAYPFSYTFVDDAYAQMYQSEQRVGALASVFAGLGVFIACLGLFGLATFAASQRTKEIGIRKVMGASVPHLIGLLSREFVMLVGLAFVIAAPVAYLAAERWLADFAYRVDLSVLLFAGAGAAAVVIAALTVSYQAYRTAAGDPIKALRYE